MCTVTVEVSPSQVYSQTWRSSWPRLNTWRGWATRKASRSNSRTVSDTGRPATVTSRVAGSTVTSPVRSGAVRWPSPAPARRSTLRTRATSSRGLNGLTT